jgi:hypothetical protein
LRAGNWQCSKKSRGNPKHHARILNVDQKRTPPAVPDVLGNQLAGRLRAETRGNDTVAARLRRRAWIRGQYPPRRTSSSSVLGERVWRFRRSEECTSDRSVQEQALLSIVRAKRRRSATVQDGGGAD